MSGAARRGKYAEDKVRTYLKAWAEAHANFAFNRILDAHSALGAMANPQPGDFQWFWRVPAPISMGNTVYHPTSRNGLIEVKEVNHTCRLSYKNFAVDQVGRMRIRQLAGSEPIVLVCHRTSSGNYWRAPPFEMFEQRDPATPSGSWDFSNVPQTKDVGSILEAYFS